MQLKDYLWKVFIANERFCGKCSLRMNDLLAKTCWLSFLYLSLQKIGCTRQFMSKTHIALVGAIFAEDK